MTLVKSNSALTHDRSNLFDDFLTRDFFNWGLSPFFNQSNATLPSVNIRENNEAFLVEMAAPGMKKEDFKIELDNEVLKISSEKESDTGTKEGERYTRREYSYQAFQRTFHLPKSIVDENLIQAQYENGILRVLIPKREEAKKQPARTITVQ